MFQNLINYAQQGSAEMASVIILSPFAVAVIILFAVLLRDIIKPKKKDAPEIAMEKRLANEQLRYEAYQWQDIVGELNREYNGKIPPHVLRQHLTAFNMHNKVMQ